MLKKNVENPIPHAASLQASRCIRISMPTAKERPITQWSHKTRQT